MIQEGFRAEYDKVCVGNMPGQPQDIYYEGMLLKEGLGTQSLSLSLVANLGGRLSANRLPKVSVKPGTVIRPGATQTTSVEVSVSLIRDTRIYVNGTNVD